VIHMSKTDKELTTEIVTSYIESWNARNTANPINKPQLIDLIQTVYKTIQDLPETKEK